MRIFERNEVYENMFINMEAFVLETVQKHFY